MDAESGDDDKDGLTSEWGGESRQDWLGWRNESGSWFQRRGDAILKEHSVIFNEEMVSGRERETTEEALVLREGWIEMVYACSAGRLKYVIIRVLSEECVRRAHCQAVTYLNAHTCQSMSSIYADRVRCTTNYVASIMKHLFENVSLVCGIGLPSILLTNHISITNSTFFY